MFFVNIEFRRESSPSMLVTDPDLERVRGPAAGPHGLDLDPATGRLLCACDAGVLIAIDAASGRVLGDVP